MRFAEAAFGFLLGAGITALLYASAMICWISFCNLPNDSSPSWATGLCVVLCWAGAIIGGTIGFLVGDRL